jgi:cysteinyl-tRNA synthetase
MAEPPAYVVELAERRARARAEKDFVTADDLRARILDAGWEIADGAGGFSLSPVPAAEPAAPVAADEVPSRLDEAAVFDVAVHWVCEGWPDDIERAVAAFRANAGDRTVQFVVADVTGQPLDRWGADVEVVSLRRDTGWGAARNAGLRRSLAPIVLAVDGSVEPTGDPFGSLAHALDDPTVGIAGPFGIVTHDLREFEEAAGAGPCDAVEGYLMAFRRATLARVGGFDERFRWYRTADIEWSFRVKDAGFRCLVVDVPVRKHRHRMWFETDPATRARWSKRNYYRFLDRWRGRWDLVLSGEPANEPHDHEGDAP